MIKSDRRYTVDGDVCCFGFVTEHMYKIHFGRFSKTAKHGLMLLRVMEVSGGVSLDGSMVLSSGDRDSQSIL